MSATSRTNALTAIAPLAPWRLWWCRLVLPVLRILAMSSSLGRLRSIHFGGWIVFGDLPGTGRRVGWRPGWRSRPSMLFMSNYDGELAEYLASFCIAVEPGMRWSFGSAEGFPGTRPSRRFVDYVDRRRVDEQWTYSAYPDRTVRDVDTALAVSERVARLLEADDAGFDAAHHELVEALALAPEPGRPRFWAGLWQALRPSSVKGVVVALPIAPGRSDEVRRSLEALAATEPSPFASVAGVHFARAAILPVAGRGSSGTAELLLVAAWVDGSADRFVRRLVAALGGRADALFGACAGYPGTDDADALARWILAHRLRIALFLGCRNGVSTSDIDAAIGRWERAVAYVDAVQGRALADARHMREALRP